MFSQQHMPLLTELPPERSPTGQSRGVSVCLVYKHGAPTALDPPDMHAKRFVQVRSWTDVPTFWGCVREFKLPVPRNWTEENKENEGL